MPTRQQSHAIRTMALVVCATVWIAGCGGSGAPESTSAPETTGAESTSSGTVAKTAAVGGTASIHGTVTFDGTPPKLQPLKMDADPGCMKKHDGPVMPEMLILGEGQTMANVFVHVKSGLPEGSFPIPESPVIVDQNGCRYQPHVSGVMVGQTLRILNSDGLLHNVHGLPEINSQFNRAMPASVTEVDMVFNKEEFMFTVKCDVHPWMNAYVAVLDHSYFAVTGKDGVFEIAGLPAGDYEIEAWHERLGSQTLPVSLADNAAEQLDYTFAR